MHHARGAFSLCVNFQMNSLTPIERHCKTVFSDETNSCRVDFKHIVKRHLTRDSFGGFFCIMCVTSCLNVGATMVRKRVQSALNDFLY